jgi:hypothetical protein
VIRQAYCKEMYAGRTKHIDGSHEARWPWVENPWFRNFVESLDWCSDCNSSIYTVQHNTTTRTNSHASNGVRTDDPSIRAVRSHDVCPCFAAMCCPVWVEALRRAGPPLESCQTPKKQFGKLEILQQALKKITLTFCLHKLDVIKPGASEAFFHCLPNHPFTFHLHVLTIIQIPVTYFSQFYPHGPSISSYMQ